MIQRRRLRRSGEIGELRSGSGEGANPMVRSIAPRQSLLLFAPTGIARGGGGALAVFFRTQPRDVRLQALRHCRGMPPCEFRYPNTVKINPRFGKCCTCFGCENIMGVVRILVSFQDRSMFSHIIRKVLARAFHSCGWTGGHSIAPKTTSANVASANP